MKENTDGEYQCFFFPNDFSSLVWAIYKWGIRIKPFSLKKMIKFQNPFFFLQFANRESGKTHLDE